MCLFSSLGCIKPFHFKFHPYLLPRPNGLSPGDYTISPILTPPCSLIKHLLCQFHQPPLLFSNKGRRLPHLLSAVILPLNLAIILQPLLHMLSQVLQLVISTTGWIDVHFNIADPPPLLQDTVNRTGELQGSTFARRLAEENGTQVLQKSLFVSFDFVMPSFGKKYA